MKGKELFSLIGTKEKETKKEVIKEENILKNKNIISFFKESRKLISVILATVVAIVVVGLLIPNERKVTTEVETSLKEIVEASKISTLEYIYNSTVTSYDEKGKAKYHVAYDGTVCAGFDLNKIKCEIDRENKKVVIIIPEITISSVAIDDKSFDFIFMKKKYDDETTLQEIYNLSYEDLENKARTNKTVMKMAYESAVDGMKAITMPLESKLPNGYTFDFRKESEAK